MATGMSGSRVVVTHTLLLYCTTLFILYSLSRYQTNSWWTCTNRWNNEHVCVCVCTCTFSVCLFSLVQPPYRRSWMAKKSLVSAICACVKFSRNLGNRVILVFFCVWITHNRVILVFFHVIDEFSLALVLHIIYTDEVYSDWKPWRNDRVVIV